jgi:hypothetical protein
METENPGPPDPLRLKRRTLWQAASAAVIVALLTYLAIAYCFMPLVWRRYVRRHPWLDSMPGITLTKDGIPGDPINVALVGSEAELVKAMTAAGWDAADRLGLRSDLRIAADTMLHRVYDRAPVSNLYLFGRKEDLAFEQPVGNDPRRRHHVRFWRSDQCAEDGRPVWLGSITFDERVGFSHTTGQITHHIAPDVDTERDRLFQQLQAAGCLASTEMIDDFHPVRQGRNGGGDPWRTDGRLALGVIVGK